MEARSGIEGGAVRTGIKGPFSTLEPGQMRRLLLISGAVSLVLLIAMAIIDERIKQGGGPGILGLEVAGTVGRAAEILAQWGDTGRDFARISLIIDFPFLVAYAIFFGAACTAIGRRLTALAARGNAAGGIARPLARLAPWLGWAFVLAAVLDTIENIALLRVLEFDLTPWVGTAQLTASPKLMIFGAGIAFLLFSLLVTARLKRPAGEDDPH